MKGKKFSLVPLLLGVALGLLALWAGTTPVTGEGAMVFGGVPSFTDQWIGNQWVAVRTTPCWYAEATTWQGCSGYKPPGYPEVQCEYGSSIHVASNCSGTTGYTVGPSGISSCSGDIYGWCQTLYNATVY